MKATLLTIASFFILEFCDAQQVVIDPQHALAAGENGAARSSAEMAHNNYLGRINTNLNEINVNVGSIVLAQNIIYRGLANVNSALKNGLTVKNMAATIADITNYLGQCMELARSQPYLLLFATNFETSIRVRSLDLVSDVSGYILKEGSNMLADYNSRDQLLRNVMQQLQIIDGLAYGAWRAMYWAKQRGIIASVNPYAGWISKDKAFVSQIIANAKYLKQ